MYSDDATFSEYNLSLKKKIVSDIPSRSIPPCYPTPLSAIETSHHAIPRAIRANIENNINQVTFYFVSKK